MFKLFTPKNARIRNPGKQRSGYDFEFNLFAFLVMIVLLLIGFTLQSLLAGLPSPALILGCMLGLVVATLMYCLLPHWVSLPLATGLALATVFASGLMIPHLDWEPAIYDFISIGALLAACYFGPGLQVITHWDKVVVLRLGRFHKVHGPGPFFLWPLIDRCAAFVDTRIRVTDFSAEKILTRDTVPVHVDALAFWMIWDAQKAILEVENFLEAVTLSAQTALRDSIGKYSLTTLLSERETLYNEIQQILDAKTNPWGISILSVEFTDIELPQALQDVMSKQAQAEREKEARLILGEAEIELATQFCQAAEQYRGQPEALNLRAMHMVYDSIKTRGSMVLLPSGVLDSMNLGSVMGISKMAESANGQPASGQPLPNQPADQA